MRHSINRIQSKDHRIGTYEILRKKKKKQFHSIFPRIYRDNFNNLVLNFLEMMQKMSFLKKLDFSKNITSKNKILKTIYRFLGNPRETENSWKKVSTSTK